MCPVWYFLFTITRSVFRSVFYWMVLSAASSVMNDKRMDETDTHKNYKNLRQLIESVSQNLATTDVPLHQLSLPPLRSLQTWCMLEEWGHAWLVDGWTVDLKDRWRPRYLSGWTMSGTGQRRRHQLLVRRRRRLDIQLLFLTTRPPPMRLHHRSTTQHQHITPLAHLLNYQFGFGGSILIGLRGSSLENPCNVPRQSGQQADSMLLLNRSIDLDIPALSAHNRL